MIGKIIIPILLGVLFTTLYFHFIHLRRRHWSKRILLWLAAFAIMAFSVQQARQPHYFPIDIQSLFCYIDLLALIVTPAFIVAIGGLIGRCFGKRLRGELVGCTLALCSMAAYLYGNYVGPTKIEVRHIDYYSNDLPDAFDGYRILHFGDLHTGSFVGWRRDVLQRAVDSIMAQKADVAVFTGDIQNMMPSEIEAHRSLLDTISAPDGVFAVLGNHDYPKYIHTIGMQEDDSLDKTCLIEQEMGWTLLRNENRCIRRGTDSIYIAGMENDGEGRFPAYGNVQQALWRVSTYDFVVMLEHDPASWRRKILRECHAQLTLSGHTHGGQISLFGLSPARLFYRELEGLHELSGRSLFVTRGIGGAVPFRLGVSPEIAVITLRKKPTI